jgi:hypothetical protein
MWKDARCIDVVRGLTTSPFGIFTPYCGLIKMTNFIGEFYARVALGCNDGLVRRFQKPGGANAFEPHQTIRCLF